MPATVGQRATRTGRAYRTRGADACAQEVNIHVGSATTGLKVDSGGVHPQHVADGVARNAVEGVLYLQPAVVPGDIAEVGVGTGYVGAILAKVSGQHLIRRSGNDVGLEVDLVPPCHRDGVHTCTDVEAVVGVPTNGVKAECTG